MTAPRCSLNLADGSPCGDPAVVYVAKDDNWTYLCATSYAQWQRSGDQSRLADFVIIELADA